MSLNAYLDDVCTTQIGVTEMFAGPGSVFAVTAVPDQVYKYAPATATPTRLSLNTDYSMNMLSLSVTVPLQAGEYLFCLPANRNEFNISGSSGASRSSVRQMWLKRSGAFTYTNLLVYSQDSAAAASDVVTPGITFAVGVAQGFAGLQPNGLIGRAVVGNNDIIGYVLSNTDTEITLDMPFSGTVDTRIIDVARFMFSMDNVIFSSVLKVPDVVTDAPVLIYIKDSVVIPNAAINYPNISVVVDYTEFVV